MKKAPKQTRTVSKKQKVLIAIAGAVLALVSWWVYANFMPHPLGNKLEYLGKEDFGGGLFFQDYRPYSVYYYGTDMTAEEVVQYFKGVTVDNPSDLIDIQQRGGSPLIYLTNKANKSFVVIYNTSPAKASLPAHIKSQKRYIISIKDTDYQTARDSL